MGGESGGQTGRRKRRKEGKKIPSPNLKQSRKRFFNEAENSENVGGVSSENLTVTPLPIRISDSQKREEIKITEE